MQFPGQGKPPVGILFDCDMAAIDDPLALALLYGLDGKGEARVISVTLSSTSLAAAAYCEAVGRFYAGAVSAAFGAYGRTLPIGVRAEAAHQRGGDEASRADDRVAMLAAALDKKASDGAPAYPHGIRSINDTADPEAVIRNGLTAQHDQNAIVVLAGPATNLVKLLDVPGAKEWAARKVRVLVVAAGAFPEAPAEPTITADLAAARRLFGEWPTPIVASDQEVAQSLAFPASSIEKDFAWTANHPVADAYRAHRSMPYDAPTAAMTAVLYATRPNEGYFKLSEPGVIRILEDGRTKLMPAADGKHRHLALDPAQKERIVKVFTEVASAKPVPRTPRFRQQQQQQQKQVPPPKPPENKPPPARP